MNDLIAAPEAEQGFKILRAMAGDNRGIGTGIGRQAAGYPHAVQVHNIHRITAFKNPRHGLDPCR